MKVAVAQIDCTIGDIAANCDKLAKIAVESKEQGANLVVFPELIDTGYAMKNMQAMASDLQGGQPIKTIKNAAKQNELYIIAGISEREHEILYNVAIMVDPHGEIIAKYRKAHLYTPSGEGVFRSGNELVTFALEDFTIGLMICYDIRFPEMARSLALAGADVLVVPTAWPFPRVEHWQLLTRVRALENQCYLVGANRVGVDDSFILCGNSRIIDPHGVIVSSASEDREEIIYADLDSEKISFVRNRMAVFDHRRSDIYRT